MHRLPRSYPLSVLYIPSASRYMNFVIWQALILCFATTSDILIPLSTALLRHFLVSQKSCNDRHEIHCQPSVIFWSLTNLDRCRSFETWEASGIKDRVWGSSVGFNHRSIQNDIQQILPGLEQARRTGAQKHSSLLSLPVETRPTRLLEINAGEIATLGVGRHAAEVKQCIVGWAYWGRAHQDQVWCCCGGEWCWGRHSCRRARQLRNEGVPPPLPFRPHHAKVSRNARVWQLLRLILEYNWYGSQWSNSAYWGGVWGVMR